jgi:hypothetical protein
MGVNVAQVAFLFPEFVKQTVAGEDLAWTARQGKQDAELRGRKFNGFAVANHATPNNIDGKVAPNEDFLNVGGKRLAAQNRLEACT